MADGMSAPFRLIVTGGRDYPDRDRVFAALDQVLADKGAVWIIHGACCVRGKPTELRGADRWAQEWAQEREQPYTGFPAPWASLGNAAGPARNRQMAGLSPNGVVAFKGGSGTQGMIDIAKQAGIPVWDLREGKP